MTTNKVTVRAPLTPAITVHEDLSQPLDEWDRILAKSIAQSLTPANRLHLNRDFFSRVDQIGQRDRANRFADLVEDYTI